MIRFADDTGQRLPDGPPSRNQLLYGRAQPLPERIPLRVGPLALVFEEGDLRYIQLGEREVIRRIYVAVRDQDWVTIPHRVSDLVVDRRDDSFQIRFLCQHRERHIDFTWTGTIEGDARGTIRYAMEGKARSTFLRNRIGICVLHPASECAGHRCRIEHADGRVESGRFPLLISPHQPFEEIRAITHEIEPGVSARVEFHGDVFEMEDQRNWTDATFKTYSTPLSLPIPVEVLSGSHIQQSVRLELHGPARAPICTPGPLVLSLEEKEVAPLPKIGLAQASHGRPLSAKEAERIRALRLSHLRADIHLYEPAGQAAFAAACRDAEALELPLELAIFASDNAESELDQLRRWLQEGRPRIARWLLFHQRERSTREKLAAMARRALAGYDPSCPFFGGTNNYFVEINRALPPAASLDGVCYSINPQVHAFDYGTMVENLQGLAATVECAAAFSNGLPLAVTPVTLKPRPRSGASRSYSDQAPDGLPRPVDPRQASLFGAAWTLGCLGALGRPEVASVTLFETTGWRGVMETDEGSPPDTPFPRLPGCVFPVYHVLADIGERREGSVRFLQSTEPLLAGGLALQAPSGTALWVASYSPERQWIRIRGLGSRLTARRLNEETALQAICDPEGYRSLASLPAEGSEGVIELELLPFETARLSTGTL